jgi:hypothetical protein
MSPVRRACLATLSLTILAAGVGFFDLRAQNPGIATGDSKSQDASAPQKPVWKPAQVTSNDSVVLLAGKHWPATPETFSAATAPAQPSAVKSLPEEVAATETARKAVEVSSLQKQILDKSKRITLLMRLFVEDERPFLNDPSNPNVDESGRDRRKYAQDELLWETAELARLKTRLNQITAAR